MKTEFELWYRVGNVERLRQRRPRSGRRWNRSYRWTTGYSLDPEGRNFPWATRYEACAMSAAVGKRAKFATTEGA